MHRYCVNPISFVLDDELLLYLGKEGLSEDLFQRG